MNNIFFPFEKKSINCDFDINAINSILSCLCKKPNKVLRCYKDNNQLVYKTHPGFIVNTQYYRITKPTNNTLEIYSRSNMLWSFLYIFFMVITIILITYSIFSSWKLPDKIVVFIIGLFNYVIGNGLPKILRLSQIDNILVLIEKEIHLTTAST